MTFINRLTDKEDYLPELIDKIQKSNLPLFLYGAGKYASALYSNCLRAGGIKFDEIVVSTLPALSKNNELYFYGYQVKEFDRAVTEYSCVNVLAGLSVKQVLEKLKSNPRVKNIFFYDVTFKGYKDLM